LLGLGFIIAAACIFNNFADRKRDRKMNRTQDRAFAKNRISTPLALGWGLVLFLAGNFLFLLMGKPLALLAANAGFFLYVFIYTLWKDKTVYATAIGSIAGALPPVVGYLTVSQKLDGGAWLLFFMLVLWQMPHFYAIALMHLEDYKRAGILALPVVKGHVRTQIHMALYIFAFIVTTALMTAFGYTGPVFLTAALLLGLGWFIKALAPFRSGALEDPTWNRSMFRYSLVVINILCLCLIGGSFF
jgi:protoheme IX farnesyltransferase